MNARRSARLGPLDAFQERLVRVLGEFVERLRDLVAEIRPEALPADAPDDLADQPPESDRVIAMRRAGRPPRLLPRQLSRDFFPIEQIFVLKRRPE